MVYEHVGSVQNNDVCYPPYMVALELERRILIFMWASEPRLDQALPGPSEVDIRLGFVVAFEGEYNGYHAGKP